MRQQLNHLREAMLSGGVDAYILFISDYHASEYICDYFKAVEYVSGFTGSNGFFCVTRDEAALFTDGRYFLQAELELKDSGITLMRTDEDAALTDYLGAHLPRPAIVGLDARTLNAARAARMERMLGSMGITLNDTGGLMDGIFTDRPPLPQADVYLLNDACAGKSAQEKLRDLRQFMEIERANIHLLTSLDDIAWLLNIRGGDIRYTPLVLAYAVIREQDAILFMDEGKLTGDVRAALTALNITLSPYEEVYGYVHTLTRNDRVLLSSGRVNRALYRAVAERAEIVDEENPTTFMKARKNAVEQDNLKRAHLKDGAAMAQLLYALKAHADILSLTEADVAQKADALRKAQEGCIGPSFATIAGYEKNAAIVHYQPKKGTDARLRPRGLLLIDSGGQYYEGTTDITRTLALGPLTIDEKKHYTLVLKGLLAFSGCVFPRGCQGTHLDVLARAPLWKNLLDYQHGTGHGIGYMLCVHEPPIRVRWNAAGGNTPLEPGMVLSVEPGLYIASSHGVRLENQLLVVPHENSPDYFRFETLTLVPFDTDAIDRTLLNCEETAALNAYHARVYDALKDGLPPDECAWLRAATLPLG